jgi:hypothetical protein
MTARLASMMSRRLRPPMMALLWLAAAQLLVLAAASCDGEGMPVGAVRVQLSR